MSAPCGMRSCRSFPTPWAVCLAATLWLSLIHIFCIQDGARRECEYGYFESHLYRAPLRYRRYNGSDSGRKRRTFLNAGTIKITRIINCKSEVERKHRFRKNVIRTEAGPPHVFPWGKHDTPLLPESARQIDSFVEGDYQARSRSGSNGTSLQCQCGFQTVLVCGIQKSNEPSQSVSYTHLSPHEHMAGYINISANI